MKLVKFLLASSLLAACLQPLQLLAPDSQAQALAREALAKKLREMQPAPAGTNLATPAPVAVKKTAPAAAPTAPAPAPTVVPAPVAAPADTAADARAREALEKKMRELLSQPTVAPPVTTPPVIAQPAAPVPVAPAPPPVVVQQPPSPRPPSQDAAKIAKAREALHQKMNEIAATAPVETRPESVAPVTSPLPGRPAVAPTPRKTKRVVLAFPPLPQPPSPLSSEKKQRLDDLLRRYQAEEITPEQYHTERSKLMAP